MRSMWRFLADHKFGWIRANLSFLLLYIGLSLLFLVRIISTFNQTQNIYTDTMPDFFRTTNESYDINYYIQDFTVRIHYLTWNQSGENKVLDYFNFSYCSIHNELRVNVSWCDRCGGNIFIHSKYKCKTFIEVTEKA